MAYIDLTQGKVALIDDEDYEYLSQWKWYYHKSGYAVRTDYSTGQQRSVKMHRLVNDTPIGYDTDHKNRNKLDNRKSNLRTATRSQNSSNYGVQAHNTSGHKGVRWHKVSNRWQSRISYQGVTITLGLYREYEDACNVYDNADIQLRGQFASLGSLAG